VRFLAPILPPHTSLQVLQVDAGMFDEADQPSIVVSQILRAGANTYAATSAVGCARHGQKQPDRHVDTAMPGLGPVMIQEGHRLGTASPDRAMRHR